MQTLCDPRVCVYVFLRKPVRLRVVSHGLSPEVGLWLPFWEASVLGPCLHSPRDPFLEPHSAARLQQFVSETRGSPYLWTCVWSWNWGGRACPQPRFQTTPVGSECPNQQGPRLAVVGGGGAGASRGWLSTSAHREAGAGAGVWAEPGRATGTVARVAPRFSPGTQGAPYYIQSSRGAWPHQPGGLPVPRCGHCGCEAL